VLGTWEKHVSGLKSGALRCRDMSSDLGSIGIPSDQLESQGGKKRVAVRKFSPDPNLGVETKEPARYLKKQTIHEKKKTDGLWPVAAGTALPKTAQGEGVPAQVAKSHSER